MSHPHALTSLTPREAITDALLRALIGLDRYDASIFNSAFEEDIIFELNIDENDKTTIHGLSDFRTQFLDHVGPMDTTHRTSNTRIDVGEGAETAYLTTYTVGTHCEPGKGQIPSTPKFVVCGESQINLVKDNQTGLWKMKKWVLDVIWREGDFAVMKSTS